MLLVLIGKCHLFSRAHINTDEIIPARYLNSTDENFLSKHAMEDIDPDFINRVSSGDFLVAGENFGCGSSREHAIWALRGVGISAILAENFARIFFRNAVNNGMIAIKIPEISKKINDGDKIEINLKSGKIYNQTQKIEIYFQAIPNFVQEISNAGGLLNKISKKI